MAPLASLSDFGWVNLQGGPSEGRSELALALPDAFDALAGGEPSLDEFAAAVAATVVLVTVDTMAAHVAGAMVHPAMVLVPATPHFYWGLNRTDCPWYPSFRLFRKPPLGTWADAVASLVMAART